MKIVCEVCGSDQINENVYFMNEEDYLEKRKQDDEDDEDYQSGLLYGVDNKQ